MERHGNKEVSNDRDQKSITLFHRSLLETLHPLSGKEVLDRVLEQEDARQLIQQMPQEDFFWLVKKVGDDDSLPLLELASKHQWQYLLDLEIWREDRLDLEQSSRWIKRLQQADCGRLVKWLIGEGHATAYYYLFRSIHVEEVREDEACDLSDDFFSVDGHFYVKVLNEAQKETIESILRTMAGQSLQHYQALLLGLSGVLPAELEENMYRMRNVRLAEHGFLPFEEALSVYAPLKPETLVTAEPKTEKAFLFDEEVRELAPISPLIHASDRNLFTEVSSRISNDLLLDRIQLEFAGLCNQIISADGNWNNELDALINTCRKAAGFLNLALENLCGSNISSAEKITINNPLVSIFRVGFGLALELKWETERWFRTSWFHSQNLDLTFWGDIWGGTLTGLLKDKPRLYAGFKGGKEYKDFESFSELVGCRKLLGQVKVLDTLFKRIAADIPLKTGLIKNAQLTFYPLLFNLFARKLVNSKSEFSSISPGEMKAFFGCLRVGDRKAPFKMPGFEKSFVEGFSACLLGSEGAFMGELKDALSSVWQEFREEYKWIYASDLDEKFTKFFWVRPSPGSVAP